MVEFRYMAKCITYVCQGHPDKGPLYMVLHAVEIFALGGGSRNVRPHAKTGALWSKCNIGSLLGPMATPHRLHTRKEPAI